jgi:hypothetical protein
LYVDCTVFGLFAQVKPGARRAVDVRKKKNGGAGLSGYRPSLLPPPLIDRALLP